MPYEDWERNATWWQERFTAGADPEYEEQILPLLRRHLEGCLHVLDIGAGEGQVSRMLAESGASFVVGAEPASSQVREAKRRGGGPRYVAADASALPFSDRSFDAVVACLVLEHVESLDDAFSEIARVLEPGGRAILALNHPLLQTPGSGWIDDRILEEQYWRIGPYLPEDFSMEEVEKGVILPFFHRPLGRYVNGLADRGLLLARMEEPPPPPGFLARAPEYVAAATIPRLLLLRAEKVHA